MKTIAMIIITLMITFTAYNPPPTIPYYDCITINGWLFCW